MIMSTDFIGTIHGQFEVISRNSTWNRKVRWDAKCLLCNNFYVHTTDVIKKNIGGCSSCARKNIPRGAASVYWKGGKYISSVFLSNVKRGARKRGIEVSIVIEDLDAIWEKQEGRCAYTGRALSLSGDDCTASLDRIDSSKGYIPFNIQFVHKSVNVMKWALSEEDFLGFIEEIYKHKVENGKSLHKEQLSSLFTNKKVS